MSYSTKKSTTRNTSSSNTNKTILLVDHHFVRRKMHSKLLQKAGCCVALADNDADMLAKLLISHHYDLIVIDVSLTHSVLPLIEYALGNKLARHDSIIILIPFNISRGLAEAFERIGIDAIVRRSWLCNYVSRWLEFMSIAPKM